MLFWATERGEDRLTASWKKKNWPGGARVERNLLTPGHRRDHLKRGWKKRETAQGLDPK